MRHRAFVLWAAVLTTVMMLTGFATGGGRGGSVASARMQGDSDLEQVEALRCWRRVEQNAVRVGEHFTMTLTCSVVETNRGRTVLDMVGLEPETIDIPPFEVLGGQRFADVQDGPRRFFQYQYTLRLIGEDYFGQDVQIPALALNYRIERSVDGGAALPGRELTYILPSESIRVLSLVPDEMPDIRGLPSETLGEADARLFRASMAMLAGATLGVLGFLVLVVGIVRASRERGAAVEREERIAPDASIVRGALGELIRLQQVSQSRGWSGELVERALTALRLAGAVALSYRVAQKTVQPDIESREGELRIRIGLLRPRMTVVSSAITPDVMARGLERLAAAPTPETTPAAQLDGLRAALSAFTAARFGRNGDLPTDMLTRELDHAITLVRPLPFRSLAPVRRVERLVASARAAWQQRWTH